MRRKHIGDFLSIFNDPNPQPPHVAGAPAPLSDPAALLAAERRAQDAERQLEEVRRSNMTADQRLLSEVETLRRENAERDRLTAEAQARHNQQMRALVDEANQRNLAWQVEAEVQKIVAHYNGDIDTATLDRSSLQALHASVPRALEAFRATEQFFYGRFSSTAAQQRQGQAQATVEGLLPGPQGAPPQGGFPTANNAGTPPGVQQQPGAQQWQHPQLSPVAAQNYAQHREMLHGRITQVNAPPPGQLMPQGYPQLQQPSQVFQPQGFPSGPAQPGVYQQPVQQQPQPAPQGQWMPDQSGQMVWCVPTQTQQGVVWMPVHAPQQQQAQPPQPQGLQPPVAPTFDPAIKGDGRPLSPAEIEAARYQAAQVAQASRQNPSRLQGMTNNQPAVAQHAIGGGPAAPMYQGPAVTTPHQHPMYRN